MSKQRAVIDKESPWCKVVYIRERHKNVRAVRMVGGQRSPGSGKSAYLHIEGMDANKLLHISGEANLRAIAYMILDAFK